MFYRYVGALLGLAMMGMAGTANATLIIESGELVGFTNLDVGGMTFDVEILEGSCNGLFEGCDGFEDFAFNTQAMAEAGAQALLDDLSGTAFDSDNSSAFGALVFGCGPRLSGCITFIPFEPLLFGRVNVAVALNACDEVDGSLGTCTGSDSVFSFTFFANIDTSGSTGFNYGRFTKVEVPEPATLWLMVVGLLPLAFLLRRKKSLGVAAA